MCLSRRPCATHLHSLSDCACAQRMCTTAAFRFLGSNCNFPPGHPAQPLPQTTKRRNAGGGGVIHTYTAGSCGSSVTLQRPWQQATLQPPLQQATLQPPCGNGFSIFECPPRNCTDVCVCDPSQHRRQHRRRAEWRHPSPSLLETLVDARPLGVHLAELLEIHVDRRWGNADMRVFMKERRDRLLLLDPCAEVMPLELEQLREMTGYQPPNCTHALLTS